MLLIWKKRNVLDYYSELQDGLYSGDIPEDMLNSNDHNRAGANFGTLQSRHA